MQSLFLFINLWLLDGERLSFLISNTSLSKNVALVEAKHGVKYWQPFKCVCTPLTKRLWAKYISAPLTHLTVSQIVLDRIGLMKMKCVQDVYLSLFFLHSCLWSGIVNHLFIEWWSSTNPLNAYNTFTKATEWVRLRRQLLFGDERL